MGRAKFKLTVYGLAFFIFMANLTLVEDAFNRDTCDWICRPDLSTNIDEKLRDMMAQARLIKLKILKEERVDREKCANQAANVTSGDSSTVASVWLKNVTDEKQKTRGSMQFITETLYEGIFTLGDSNLHLNVSCVFTSASTTKSNYSSRRLTFDTAQSVLYYIEHDLANNTKTNATFLTLLRVENRTRLSFGATGTAGNSYLVSTKDNELTFSDGWLFVAVIIWFVYLLYSPAIFLLFRPTEVTVMVVRNQIRKTQKETKYPVQETKSEDTSDVFLPVDITGVMHRPPDEGTDESSPHQSDSPGSDTVDITDLDLTDFTQPTPDEDNESSPLVEETENPTEQNSKIVGGPRPTYKASPVFVGQANTEKEGILKDEAGPTGAGRQSINPAIRSNRTYVGSNAAADCRLNIIDINPYAAQETDNVQSFRDEEKETVHVPAIIVGGTYPVGLGSFIGNSLFSTIDKNKLCKTVKFIFIFFVPLLLFTGFGDLLLILVPSLHSKIADHLPFPFLTSSVLNGIIANHPIVLFLVVFPGLICYLIRLFCVCFLSNDTLKTAWTPCSAHRIHPTCFVFERLLCLFSNIPLCHWFFETCLSLCPCKECKKLAPPDCREYLELPENIRHNLEKLPDIFVKQPDIFVKHWDSFVGYLSAECYKKKTIASFLLLLLSSIFKVIFFLLAVVFLFAIDILFSSPLVCLCHGRLWILKTRFKKKFKGSKFILPIFELLLMLFSLVWVIFFLFISAVPLGVATTGLIISLANNTNEVLPHLTIFILVVHYFWSCYSSFRTPFRDLAKILYSSYQKKFDELEKTVREINHVLIHYKQGGLGDHVKVIPKELFHDGCNDHKLKPRNQVTLLFSKLGLTLLALLFVFLIISSNVSSDAVAPPTSNVITFLAVAYYFINGAIIGEKLDFSQEDADKTVDNFIKRKQDSD